MSSRLINIPNLLTLLRILLVPVFVMAVLYGYMDAALIIFVIASITDAFDGLIARLFHQKSVIGSYLDPVADKTLIIAVYLCLAVTDIIPVWLTVIVISRDIIILAGFMIVFFIAKERITEVKPSIISKITTFLQLTSVFFVLLNKGAIHHYLLYLLISTAVFTVSSGLDYIRKGFKLVEI